MQNLGTLSGGAYSVANAINSNGWIVGTSGSAQGQRAALWKDGSIYSLGVLGGDTYSSAYGLNAEGFVVGVSGSSSGRKPFVFDGASMVDLNSVLEPLTASGWMLDQALAINASGQIVGTGVHNGQQRGFLLNPLNPVPEPATLAVLGLGFLGLRRRRRS